MWIPKVVHGGEEAELEEIFREFAAQRGWTISHRIRENADWTFHQSIRAVVDEAQLYSFEHLLIGSLDWFFGYDRSRGIAGARALHRAGVTVKPLDEPEIEYLLETEMWVRGKPAYGLARVGGKALTLRDSKQKFAGVLEPRPGEAGVVTMIFKMFVKNEMTVAHIVEFLNRLGGRRWTAAIVRRILRFPYHGGAYPGVENVKVPPLIDRTLWHLAQDKLNT
jgi:hypothetical protein